MPSGIGRARAELRERLEARREEIEAAALTRVRAISDPSAVADPAYAGGLRAAVSAAVAYGIETTGREGGDAPVPVALLAQARMAARAGIPLDTVLRRYFAGYSLLGYYVLEEAGNAGLTDGAELKRLLAAHAGLFDRLLAAVGEEYGREAEARRGISERRQSELIKRLLVGELLEAPEIVYDFSAWHLGVVAEGTGSESCLRRLAHRLDTRTLLAERGGESELWAWLGARSRMDPVEALRVAAELCPNTARIGLGEPGQGVAGWRLTHRQALASKNVARRGAEAVVCYADVALLASAVQDDLLADSLHQLYLAPLADRDAGGILRETLRAYVGAHRNLASAAGALMVSPRTVGNRLRRVEVLLGRPLTSVLCDVELALRLDELDLVAGS